MMNKPLLFINTYSIVNENKVISNNKLKINSRYQVILKSGIIICGILKKIELDYLVIFSNNISYTISFLNINMLICQ